MTAAAGAPSVDPVWTGGWVADRLGARIESDPVRSLVPVEALVGLALRRNPRRAHLLVSTVLAKHVPTPPLLVESAGALLGVLVADRLEGRDAAARAGLARDLADELTGAGTDLWSLRDRLHRLEFLHPAVTTLGYAETATGLGRLVADQLGAYYLHSTRRAVPGLEPVAGFEEEHSHATGHRLVPSAADWLKPRGTVVLVDDEFSTGTTAINTVRALHALEPQSRYVVAALVDLRGDADRARFDVLAAELGVAVDVVSLGAGSIHLPEGFAAAASEHVGDVAPAATPRALADVARVSISASVPSDRAGSPAALRVAPSREAAASLAARLAELPAARTLVLATEENMAFPVQVAAALDQLQPGVLFSSTTRSPIAPVDDPQYAIRSAARFASHDRTIDGPGPRFAYNLTAGGERFDRIVLMPEPGTTLDALSRQGGPLEALRARADEVVVATVEGDTVNESMPLEPLRGPAFGSYEPDEVGWLLQDLGGVALEAPAADREAAIQSGRAHYAESLPQEYVPSDDYQRLYAEALDRSAARVALAVGVAAELVMDGRERPPVLVSLARAGTPIGILMRRWIARTHGADSPHRAPFHYTMSIVRGVGIDTTALAWLAERHDPADVVFVDGWTGKGAIARELTAALDQHAADTGVRFSDDLVVLADPGHCVRTFGTRDDYLIPSACLNSTVSGLVSRTVYSEKLIAPGEFHGAKFYSELAGSDVSRAFLDAVESHFESVRADAEAAAAELVSTDRTPTWEGWAAVERLQREYGLDDVNLVKPGVGETTRVLLRRVPWKILVRPDALSDVAHVLLLARQRGVDVVEVDDLPYSCVGLIKPLADGEQDAAQGSV
ncbi:phosphoribosyltransferase-like predicted ribonucleoside biosynthesis protein [Frondihabitans sp. PhB188]|uniref:phosphoribosyltransferase domain-containing protein n=1 Tax=Frondihabitans sp. PhB188 TaxID=2485200 RepID=UPI000F4AF2DB|nr:phosphoribosyltransferase domain-containing protein [Frondihabitans sp. PhB188]ROQ40952.1 phosphoribosyltransferase-like predicted ribonucleoside biosynthesis protein [Frondihabitans sp. PhB188]